MDCFLVSRAYKERGHAMAKLKKVLLKIVTQKLGLLVYWGSILRILKFP